MPERQVNGWRRVAVATGISVLAVLVSGFWILGSVRSDLLEEAESDLLLLMSLRISRLQEGIEQMGSEMALWSDTGALKESLGLYAEAWDELGPNAGAHLHGLYVDDSPYQPGERHLLNDAGDGSTYSALHRARQPRVDEFLEIHEYYDVFMVDPDGNVVYTYFKEPDFATNLVDGPLSGSGLGDAFREAAGSTDRRKVAVADFDFYEPSEEPAMFVASPTFDDQDKLLGVLVAQIGASQVDEVMRFTSGLGSTGETYAVGDDGLMRSDSRFTEGADLLALEIDTEPVRRAFSGESGSIRTVDYLGEEVIAAFGLMEVEGLRWAIIAEANVAEIVAPAKRLRSTLLLTGIVVVLLVALATIPSRDRQDWLRSPAFAEDSS